MQIFAIEAIMKISNGSATTGGLCQSIRRLDNARLNGID